MKKHPEVRRSLSLSSRSSSQRISHRGLSRSIQSAYSQPPRHLFVKIDHYTSYSSATKSKDTDDLAEPRPGYHSCA